MASFDHRVRELSLSERVWGMRDEPCRCDYGPGQKRCTNHAAFLCTYDYVTGRAGRISTSRRKFCVEHAAKFSRQHGIKQIEKQREVALPQLRSE